MEAIFQEMLERWKSPIVARTSIAVFSGGLLNEKTIANYDSAGVGIAGRFRVGRKVVYPVQSVIRYLESRSAVISERKQQSAAAQ